MKWPRSREVYWPNEPDAILLAGDMCRDSLETWGVGRLLYRTTEFEYFTVRASLWPGEDLVSDRIYVGVKDALWLYFGPLCNRLKDPRSAFYRGEEFPPCDGEGEISFAPSAPDKDGEPAPPDPRLFGEGGGGAVLVASDRCRGGDANWGMYRELYRTPDFDFFVVRTSLWPGEERHRRFPVSLEGALWLYFGPLCEQRMSPKEAFYSGEEFPLCSV